MLSYVVNSRRLLPRASCDPRRSLNCRSICASHLPSFLSNLQRSAVKPLRSNSFRINTYKNRHFARFWHHLSPFRIDTSKGVSKQRTLSIFRMNTGSVDILVRVGVPQAIEVVGKAEEQGLANLDR